MDDGGSDGCGRAAAGQGRKRCQPAPARAAGALRALLAGLSSTSPQSQPLSLGPGTLRHWGHDHIEGIAPGAGRIALQTLHFDLVTDTQVQLGTEKSFRGSLRASKLAVQGRAFSPPRLTHSARSFLLCRSPARGPPARLSPRPRGTQACSTATPPPVCSLLWDSVTLTVLRKCSRTTCSRLTLALSAQQNSLGIHPNGGV